MIYSLLFHLAGDIFWTPSLRVRKVNIWTPKHRMELSTFSPNWYIAPCCILLNVNSGLKPYFLISRFSLCQGDMVMGIKKTPNPITHGRVEKEGLPSAQTKCCSLHTEFLTKNYTTPSLPNPFLTTWMKDFDFHYPLCRVTRIGIRTIFFQYTTK